MTAPIFLELHRCQHLVPAGCITLIVVVDLLTVLHACSHHVCYIQYRHPFANVMGNRRVSESVCMQGKSTSQCFPNLFQPKVQFPYKVFDVTIVGALCRKFFLVANREYISVLGQMPPTQHNPIQFLIDGDGTWYKWAMLVLCVLSENDATRFNAIGKAIPDISPKVLTDTLKSLEADGLISRKIYAEIPPKVEYSLTELGRSLMPHINGIIGWALENFGRIAK